MNLASEVFVCVVMMMMHTSRPDIIGVRLRGGFTPGQGKVEVKLGKQWGAVCDNHWTVNEANVVCRQLGYVSASNVLTDSWYGEARGAIWIRNVSCTGLENQLSDCSYEELSSVRTRLYENVDEVNFCSYAKQAAVICMEPRKKLARLIHLGWQQVSAGPSGRKSRLVRVRRGNRWLPICADTWTSKEAIVSCRQAGLGFATLVEKVKPIKLKRPVISEVRCRGNESSLQECGLTVKRKYCAAYASLFCSPHAPDINVNITFLEDSIKIIRKIEKDMVCAKEEECISSSGANKTNEELSNSILSRKLLVFTSLVQNFGNADFLPPKVEGGWTYHTCHKHYHSMNDFATYELRDGDSRLIEVGHKVSFCLRDNICVHGIRGKYTCSRDYKFMHQGISVGCGDLYSNELDCQWIDVTDVPNGEYFLEIHSNPHLLVAEQDYTNNFVRCKVTINGWYATGENCHWPYDFDEDLQRKKFLF